MKLPDPDCRVGQLSLLSWATQQTELGNLWKKETQGEIKTESIVGMLLFLPLFFLLFLCLHLLSLFFLNHTHKGGTNDTSRNRYHGYTDQTDDASQ